MNIMKYFILALFSIVLIASCSDDEITTMTPDEMNPDMGGGNDITGEIWTGSNISFSKADGADPTDAVNQDRITDNVWITRGNNGGQIFNIRAEESSQKASSPADTEWALGTTDDVANLTFANFRTTIKPQDVVGKDLVLHLISDDIYIDIKFDSWTSSKEGGFSYTRSTR